MTKAKEAEKLRLKAEESKSVGDYDRAIELEKKYLKLRLEVIEELDDETYTPKSIPIEEMFKQVEEAKIPPKYQTGILKLDRELVDNFHYKRGDVGGFPLGNFFIFGGVKGVGKSTLIARILSGLSSHSKIAWFDFEMGKRKARQLILKFKDIANFKNFYYYIGDRELREIEREIKYQSELGVRHFFIDSMMKINTKGVERGYKSNSYISNALSALTKQLDINIYLIVQVSQETEKNGGLGVKHGNDVEYDADYIFYMLKKPIFDGKRIRKDAISGEIIFNENTRLLKCVKNRIDDRLFSIELDKSEVLENVDVEIIEFDLGPQKDSNDSVDLPTNI